MQLNRQSADGYRQRKQKRPLFLAAAGLLILAGLAWAQLRPSVEAAAAYQTKVYSVRIVNNAVLDELNRSEAAYGDMVTITRNATGDIATIQANMAEINRLKGRVTGAVIQELEALGVQSLQLRLGSLMGSEFTAGRGPVVEMKVQPIGYVQTEVISQFAAAGINQTHHRISLSISVQMQAILPGYHIQCETTTNCVIAETVIVGNIPDTYLQLDAGNPYLQQIPG